MRELIQINTQQYDRRDNHSPIYHEYIHIHAHNVWSHILKRSVIFMKVDICKM